MGKDNKYSMETLNKIFEDTKKRLPKETLKDIEKEYEMDKEESYTERIEYLEKTAEEIADVWIHGEKADKGNIEKHGKDRDIIALKIKENEEMRKDFKTKLESIEEGKKKLEDHNGKIKNATENLEKYKNGLQDEIEKYEELGEADKEEFKNGGTLNKANILKAQELKELMNKIEDFLKDPEKMIEEIKKIEEKNVQNQQQAQPKAAPQQQAQPKAAPQQQTQPKAAPQQQTQPKAAPQQQAQPKAAPQQQAQPKAAPQQQTPDQNKKILSIDAEKGIVSYTQVIGETTYREPGESLDKIFREKKEIRKEALEFLKSEFEDIKFSKREIRKVNPAILKILTKAEDKNTLLRMLDAVQGKGEFPIDEFEFNLENPLRVSDKTFKELNKYALKDNKILGSKFKTIPHLGIKSFVSRLPIIKRRESSIEIQKQLPTYAREKYRYEKENANQNAMQSKTETKINNGEQYLSFAEKLKRAAVNPDKLSTKPLRVQSEIGYAIENAKKKIEEKINDGR